MFVSIGHLGHALCGLGYDGNEDHKSLHDADDGSQYM